MTITNRVGFAASGLVVETYNQNETIYEVCIFLDDKQTAGCNVVWDDRRFIWVVELRPNILYTDYEREIIVNTAKTLVKVYRELKNAAQGSNS